MTALEKYEPPNFPVLMEQAQALAKSSIIPSHFRNKPGDVVAAMLLGQELGLGPMATMSHVVVINGNASLNAEGKVALVRKHGHSISGESGPQRARVIGRRKDTGDEMTVEWTMEMAQRANLVKPGPWKQYPEAMLWSRAVSQLCRMLFPDVLAGLSYTPEEVESFTQAEGRPAGVNEDGEVVDAEVVPEAPPATTRRRPPPQAEVEAPHPLADPEVRDDLYRRLNAIPSEYREELTAAWKAQEITSIKAVERFSPDDAAKAEALLAEFESRVANEAPFVEEAE